MKKLCVLFVLLVTVMTALAQESPKISPELSRKVDSLKNILATLPELDGTDADTTRMKLCLDIGKLYEKTQPDSAICWYASIADSIFSAEKTRQYPRRAALNATTAWYIGIVARSQGDYSKAVDQYERSLKISEELGDKSGISSCLNNLGVVAMNQGDYSKAINYYERSLKIKEELGDKAGISKCLNNLGIVARNQGDYSEAMDYYERSLKIGAELSDKAGISVCLNNLGVVAMNQGDYPKAMDYYERSLKINEELSDKAGISMCLMNFGIVARNQGDYPKAMDYYERSLKIREELSDKSGISKCLMNLGNVASDQGDYSKAMDYYERSLKIFEELSDKSGISVCLMNLGVVAMYQGDYPKAMDYYERSLKISEESGDKSGISVCLNNLGAVATYQGDYPKAIDYYERSLKIKEELGDKASLASFYPALAKVYIKQNRLEKAMPLFFQSHSITLWLLKDNFTVLTEKEKGDYLEKTGSIFNDIAEFSMLCQQFDSLRAVCCNNELILKGLLLSSSRSMMEIVSASSDTALKNTYWLLSQQRKQISEQMSTPKDERTHNVDSLETAADNTERKLVKLSDKYADAQEQFGYTWQDVQKKLQHGEAAIEFVKIKHTIFRHDSLKTDSCSYAALVLKPGDVFPQFIGLCNEESLEKLLTRGDENDFDLVDRIYGGKTRYNLYELVWKHMESALAGCNKVYFAPAGQLHQISFAAIPMPSGKLLSDEYSLVQLSSTRELIRNSGKPLPSLKLAVVYGGINYETDSTLIAELAVAHNMDRAEVSEAISIARDQDVESAWHYLPGTATEAENACKLLTGSDMDQKRRGMPRLYSGEQATEESFKNLSGKSPNVLHIATHGFTVPLGGKNEAYKVFENSFVKNFNPLFRTGLLFAGANRTWNGGKQIRGIEDGILTAYEAGQLDLSKTSLVVLSACETGLGTVKGSEGVYGLQRAFKGAGVRYIMMSLWTVPDEQTTELMSLFYSKLAGGETIRNSFAYAQNEMKKKYAPYYWAGFVLIE